MTPKEKAERLVSDIFNIETFSYCTYSQAKQCALIAVDEILNLMIKEFKWDVKHNGNIEYWQEVKQEIEKL
jgi:thiamine pyrophosphokinase